MFRQEIIKIRGVHKMGHKLNRKAILVKFIAQQGTKQKQHKKQQTSTREKEKKMRSDSEREDTS